MKLGDELEVLYTQQQIAARVREMAAEIERDHRGKDLVLVGVLKGAFVFVSDLARLIDLPLSVDFIGLSSYGEETESSGVVKITSDLTRPIEAKHVLIVEDIVDTGLTMRYLLDNLSTRRPASVKICALLQKPSRLRTRIPIQYLGFTVPDLFVVGYGLDSGEKYRNLPFIGAVKGA
ncbi:MAG TPA: hypoxanthine phosphoribosyltransferase [Myxococcales bacterium]|jgi:hypoxanthine phosphoribosyltransferase|nr:hypoxanthine phosphoribosyltransferase [Myxococcales bacterium]